MNIIVERRWIASSNAEWGAIVPGVGWLRGGSIAGALSRAGEHIDGAEGAKILVKPDDTAEQAQRAHDAFFKPSKPKVEYRLIEKHRRPCVAIPVRYIAEAEGNVMVRRKGAGAFLITRKIWDAGTPCTEVGKPL